MPDARGDRPALHGSRLTTPWAELPETVREVDPLRLGRASRSACAYDDGLRAYEVKKPFEGVIPNLERRYKETESAWVREEIGRYMSETPCEACDGNRLKPEALAVKIAGADIGEATASRCATRTTGSARSPRS